MSTFDGTFDEIQGISADRFSGENNMQSSAFFLSHCHTDHMKGLDETYFQRNLLDRENVYLYASPVSVQILKCLHSQIASKLREIQLGVPTVVSTPHEINVTATLIPAGHCPGSVMFLFETDSKRILYTGDYRVSVSDLKKCKHFYSMGQIKKIDNMYLDTTFLTTSHPHFPSREQSIQATCQIITEWINRSERHVIELVTSAKYGYENLFVGVYNQLKLPLYIAYEAEVLQYVPEMDKVLSSTPNTAKIFVRLKPLCGLSSNSKELISKTIKVSAMRWRNLKEDSKVCCEQGGVHRVCFSTHASANEIKEFVMFLKPVKVHPCVVPNSQARKEIDELLDQIMCTYAKPEVDEFSFFQTFGSKNGTVESSSTTKLKPFGAHLLSSPTREFKRRRRL